MPLSPLAGRGCFGSNPRGRIARSILASRLILKPSGLRSHLIEREVSLFRCSNVTIWKFDAAEGAVPEHHAPHVTTGTLGRIRAWGAQSSSWITRGFAGLLIVYLSASAGLSYIDHPRGWEQLSDRAFVFAGFMLLLVGSIIREWSRLRKERYANIFDKLQAIGAALKDSNTFLAQQTLEPMREVAQFSQLFRRDIVEVLDSFAEIFSMVTGTVCRTSIKSILVDSSKLYVYTFARDTESMKVNAKLDKDRLDQKLDELRENEDFYSIFEERREFFIENDLPNRRGYRNSSFSIYGVPPQGTGIITKLFSGIGWTLPYRSTMVFPIRQLEPATGSAESAGCIGFLTVDSAFRNVFEPRIDGPLGATVSSALFHPLSTYAKLVERIEGQGT